MTPEQLRYKVAELCGWTNIHDSLIYPRVGEILGTTPSGNMDKPVPDYAGDLNAMATAEAILTPEQNRDYFSELYMICGTLLEAFSATSEQRARAFIQVMTK